MAGDCTQFRDAVINTGATLKIIEHLDRASVGASLVRNASWTLSNLCRGKPVADDETIRRCIPSLARVALVSN